MLLYWLLVCSDVMTTVVIKVVGLLEANLALWVSSKIMLDLAS